MVLGWIPPTLCCIYNKDTIVLEPTNTKIESPPAATTARELDATADSNTCETSEKEANAQTTCTQSEKKLMK